jgi:hypothetical protein
VQVNATLFHGRSPFVFGPRARYYLGRAACHAATKETDLLIQSGTDTELWENRIDGYLDVDGIRYPDGYAFEGRNGWEKGTYQNVRFNVEPKDELFVIPDGLK